MPRFSAAKTVVSCCLDEKQDLTMSKGFTAKIEI
jgi:hypothetical protein